MAKYVMALDAGTTSNRCILFNEKGEMCSVAQKEFTQYFPKPGWVEHDAEEIWSTQLEVAQEAMKNLGVTAADIAAEEQKEYNVYPKLNVYQVFNVAQTNLKEARPELYAKLEAENKPEKALVQEGDMYSFPAVDKMFKEQRWICPINIEHQDNAFYSISRNEITIPEKAQFKDGESWYGTAFHEMVHSTGAENQLNRLQPQSGFGSDEYAREELVAELGSALVCQKYGMTKNLKEDSAAYLKSWLGSLKESPSFIKTTLMDVKKATSILSQRIYEVALEMKEQQSENVAASVSAKDTKEKDVEQSVSSGSDENIEEEKVARSAFRR